MHTSCDCHECTQARWRSSLQGQIETAMRGRAEVAPSRSAAPPTFDQMKARLKEMEDDTEASAAPPSEREAAQRELKDYDPHATEGESEAFICGFLRGVEARAAVPQAARHPELRGTWPENCVQRAFVEGAKWWEFYKTGATMWQSDQRLAEKAAVEQYGEPGAAAVPAPGSEDSQIKYMVDRFLGWRLPDNFNPDGGISFKRTDPWPGAFGTNLLDATQAEQMVRYMLNGLRADCVRPKGDE